MQFLFANHLINYMQYLLICIQTNDIIVRVCMMFICAIDPHGTAWTTSGVATCSDCIEQCHCKHLMFLYMPNGHGSSIFNSIQFIVKVHPATYCKEALYTKKGIYTKESNQEQIVCISGYIIRWSKQKSSIPIVSR